MANRLMYKQVVGDSGFKTADAWNEGDHPRSENGQFGSGGGGKAAEKREPHDPKKFKNRAEEYEHLSKIPASERTPEEKARLNKIIGPVTRGHYK